MSWHGANVDLTLEVQVHLPQTGDPPFEFGVEPSGGFDAPRLDLAVGQRRVIVLLAGEALDVDGDESLVGEDDRVMHFLEGEVYALAVDEHRRQLGGRARDHSARD